MDNYTQHLESRFKIEYYDCCELGQVDKTTYTQENLHKQFVNGGIEIAVDNLLNREKQKVHILAFSIGGTIAWNFGLRGNSIKSLICVSSTRLRKETKRPKGMIELYFGENDAYKPETEWLDNMKLAFNLLPKKGHQVYYEPEFAKELSEKLVKTTSR